MQTKQHTCLYDTFNPEELLGRKTITFELANVKHAINGRTVMITGAAGTIGLELAMQVCGYAAARVILVDQAETGLNDLDLFLKAKFPQIHICSQVASITDVVRMSGIFSSTTIHLVFHAAAYKHVPIMEQHPYEAIKTNVLGTEILADLAITYRVEKFIYISTDKAIKPANVMGATKRFAEIYLQYLSSEYPDRTRFIITRFGNVLGSNGSFLVRFAQQIREGGPVTVTHPDAERYMMTVTEACQLVMEATTTSEGNEILSFDMGRPIRILELAKRMIVLSGLKPAADIEIQFTGLRPGEKLMEEPTCGTPPGMAALGKLTSIRFSPSEGACLRHWMSAMQHALDSGQPERMVAVLKAAIPEYMSVNSPFAELDLARSESPRDHLPDIKPAVRSQYKHRPNHSSNDGTLEYPCSPLE